jgi:hypothetical protein
MNFTALSFVDLKELTTDNIVEVNGEKWIVGKRHKTGVPVGAIRIGTGKVERIKTLAQIGSKNLNVNLLPLSS